MTEVVYPSPVSTRVRRASAGLRRGSRWLNDLVLGPAETPARKAYALHRLCQALCASHGIITRARGVVPQGPLILVANHRGYIDPVAICGVVPCAPIAKAEVSDWPLIGRMGARYNTLFVQRGEPFSGASVLRRAARSLAGGANVLNFPEGTTTRGGPRPFQRGVFGLARIVDVPVVPVCIRFGNPELCWIDDQTFVPHYLRSLRSKPHLVELEFGPRLQAQSFASDQEHAEAARRWIASRIPGA